MDLTGELYFVTGLAALGLAGAVLARDRASARARSFVALCGAIALWSLTVAARRAGWLEAIGNPPLSLLGGCATAPVALHFTLILAGRARRLRSALVAAYLLAAACWLSALTPLADFRPAWNVACITALGVILGGALVTLAGHVRGTLAVADPWLAHVLVATSVLAVVIGLSDIVPREPGGFPRLGPVAVLCLLLVLSLVVIRSRILDVDRLFARGLAVLVAAAAAALGLQLVLALRGPDPIALFFACVLLVVLAGPFARLLSTGTEALLDPSRRPIARALAQASASLQSAEHASAVWRLLAETRRALPSDVRLAVAVERGDGYGEPRGERVAELDSPLPRRLRAERAPVMRAQVMEHVRDGATSDERAEAAALLAQLESLGLEIVTPLLNHGRLVGWLGLGGDDARGSISGDVAAALLAVGHQAVATLDRLEAEQLARRREALAAVGEMAAGLAHEVRNPVGAIRGAAQVLTSARNPAQETEMLAVIDEETDRLGRVVGEFLDYARPGATRRERVDLGDLCRTVLRDAEAAGWGLKTEMIVAPGAPPAAIDRDQVQRALANLVRNAFEAAGPAGRLRISVEPDGPDAVRLDIEDDGPGIPESMAARLFRPFQTSKPGGTGLGLALAHRVLADHGGTIHVEPGALGGARFTLVMPAWDDGAASRTAAEGA